MSETMLATCERIGCWRLFSVTLGRGRPRRYCSDECRRQADTERKRCVARVASLRKMLRREEHLLAAMGDVQEPDREETPDSGIEHIRQVDGRCVISGDCA